MEILPSGLPVKRLISLCHIRNRYIRMFKNVQKEEQELKVSSLSEGSNSVPFTDISILLVFMSLSLSLPEAEP